MPGEETQPFPVPNYGKLPVYFAGFFQKTMIVLLICTTRYVSVFP